MATQNFTCLSSPDFPQAFESLIEYELRRVDRVLVQTLLPTCEHEFPESRYAAADGFPCNQPAVVHHLPTEQDVCLKHFQEVSRG